MIATFMPADSLEHHAAVGRALRGVGVGARVVDARVRQTASIVLCRPDRPFWMEQVLAVCSRSKPMVESVVASDSGAR